LAKCCCFKYSHGGRIGIFNNPGTGYENFIAKDVISSGGIFSGPGTGLTGTALALNIGLVKTD
jgi:hypothetical protein